MGSGLVGLYLKKHVPGGGPLQGGRVTREAGGQCEVIGTQVDCLEQGVSSTGRADGKALSLQEPEARSTVPGSNHALVSGSVTYTSQYVPHPFAEAGGVRSIPIRKESHTTVNGRFRT